MGNIGFRRYVLFANLLTTFIFCFTFSFVKKFCKYQDLDISGVVLIVIFLSLVGLISSEAKDMSMQSIHYWMMALCYPIMGLLAVHQIHKEHNSKNN